MDTREVLALVTIKSAGPEALGEFIAAALDRAAELGRDAWLAVSAAYDGDHDNLDEALQWLGHIADGDTI